MQVLRFGCLYLFTGIKAHCYRNRKSISKLASYAGYRYDGCSLLKHKAQETAEHEFNE